MGIRTNGVTFLASRAQALAQAGQVEAAAAALVDAQNELATYRELYAEPMVLLAEAVLRHARSEPPDAVRDVLLRAAARATESGGHAVAARVRATSGQLGYEL